VGVAWFRFYAELNDLLPPDGRGKRTERRFDTTGPVKDLIESCGVPHTEVDLVLINGEPAAFSRPVRDGDYISVYPAFQSLDISSVTQVRPAPPAALRFVLDVHLGRLAAYLRMLGFDTMYSNSAADRELAFLARCEDAILVTRDRYLLMRSEVLHGYWVRSSHPKNQLLELSVRFNLVSSMKPFTRCMSCNGSLGIVAPESVLQNLPPKVREKREFRRCSACGKVYWEGTHHDRMTRMLEWLKANVPLPRSKGSVP
jgi:uncharacterized protein